MQCVGSLGASGDSSANGAAGPGQPWAAVRGAPIPGHTSARHRGHRGCPGCSGPEAKEPGLGGRRVPPALRFSITRD